MGMIGSNSGGLTGGSGEDESAPRSSHCYATVSLPYEIQPDPEQPVGLVIQSMKHVLSHEEPEKFKSHILYFPNRGAAEKWYEANNGHWLKQQHVSCFPIVCDLPA